MIKELEAGRKRQSVELRHGDGLSSSLSYTRKAVLMSARLAIHSISVAFAMMFLAEPYEGQLLCTPWSICFSATPRELLHV